MIYFEYEKKGSAVYLSHLCLLKAFARTLRRAGIAVAYSNGYNPHELLYFSPPAAIGVICEREQCVAVTDEPAQTFMSKFNAVAPSGIRVIHCESLPALVRPAAVITAADYLITATGLAQYKEQLEKFTHSYVEGIPAVTGDTVAVRLKLSNAGTLRPEAFLAAAIGAIYERRKLTIVRVKMV